MDQFTTNASVRLRTVSGPSKMVAVNLTFLNQALEPFRESYISTKLVFETFEAMIYAISSYTEESEERLPSSDYQEFVHEPWQSRLSSYRNPHHKLYREPESLQVAQILNKINPVHVWSEFETLMRLQKLGGDPKELLEYKGGWYTHVFRSRKWLVECALEGLSGATMSSNTRCAVTANLALAASCQPKYGAAEENTAACLRRDMFGPGGLLFPVLEFFTRDPEDESGVEEVLKTLMYHAMDVVSIFERFVEVDQGSERRPPSYKWYCHGLGEARLAFINKIETPDSNCEWSYHIRDGMKDLHFINLWDGLWQRAIDGYCSAKLGIKELHWYMYEWIAMEAIQSHSDPRPWMPNGGNVKAVAMRLWGRLCSSADGEPINPQQVYLPGYSLSLDLSGIEQFREPNSHIAGWGHRFYAPDSLGQDDDDVIDIYDNEEEEWFDLHIEDSVEMEAYGPLIDPNDLAEAVLEKPTDQRCTVCMEDHIYSYGDGRTMKLDTCGHYFHYECTRDWLNGVSTNSNLCPECRQQFSDFRRLVRPVQSLSAESDAETDEYSDWSSSIDSHEIIELFEETTVTGPPTSPGDTQTGSNRPAIVLDSGVNRLQTETEVLNSPRTPHGLRLTGFERLNFASFMGPHGYPPLSPDPLSLLNQEEGGISGSDGQQQEGEDGER